MLGVQVASALRDLYGRNGAETISGLCGTRVVLAAPDRDTAQWSADSLGRSEIEEVSEGFSYGANTIRDGVSLTPRRELRALALPSEIMRLPNLSGYLKFPGPFPVASIRLKYVARPKAAERFVAREEGPTETCKPAGDPGNPPPSPIPETADDDGIAIPDPPGEARTGPAKAPGGAGDTVLLQRELDLAPLPGEAGGGGNGRRSGRERDCGEEGAPAHGAQARYRQGRDAEGERRTARGRAGNRRSEGAGARPGAGR